MKRSNICQHSNDDCDILPGHTDTFPMNQVLVVLHGKAAAHDVTERNRKLASLADQEHDA